MKAYNRILGIFQQIGIMFGVFARPASSPDISFIKAFITPKQCGRELILIGDGLDGSYVIPKDLEDIKYCFSPGVGPTSKFEQGLHESFGISSFLIDGSVDRIPKKHLQYCDFEKVFLGSVCDEKTINLDTWVQDKISSHHLEEAILQMDIEGGEFPSLLSCSNETLKKFRIICLEVHGLDLVYLPFALSTIEQTFRKLHENFVVCFSRQNDCCGHVTVQSSKLPRVIELSLIRRDRILDGNPLPPRNFKIRNI